MRDGPCAREWFLNGHRGPRQGHRPVPLLAPRARNRVPDQAMRAGNHISRPSRWVHPSGSGTDVAGLGGVSAVRCHGILCNRLPRRETLTFRTASPASAKVGFSALPVPFTQMQPQAHFWPCCQTLTDVRLVRGMTAMPDAAGDVVASCVLLHPNFNLSAPSRPPAA